MIEIGSLPACVGALSPSPLSAVPITLALTLAPFAVWVSMLQQFSGKRALMVTHAAMVWWLLFAALEMASPTAPCKLLFGALVQGGVALVPTAGLFFVARFTFGTSDAGRFIQDRLMVLVPLIVLIVALTSDRHGQFYAAGTVLDETSLFPSIAYHWGPLFYLAALFSYGCVVVAAVILVLAIHAAPREQRYHFSMLLTLTLLPTLGNLAYLTGMIDVAGYDPTPFLFGAALIIYVHVLLADRTFDISVLARQQMFNRLPAPVFVLSADRKVRSSNTAAAQLSSARGAPDPATAAEDPAPPPPAGEMARLIESIEEIAKQASPLMSDTVTAVPIRDRLFDVSFEPVRPPLGAPDRCTGWIVLLDDVTDDHARDLQMSRLVRETQAARYAAERDELTGLLNRRALLSAFEAAAELAMSEERTLYGILLDIDHFKQINDTLGHDVGDLALKRLAGVLCESFPSDEHIFRLGGEEFFVLYEGRDPDRLRDCLANARASLSVVDDAQEGSLVPAIRFSAGVAIWPVDGQTLSELLKAADRRLYKAKKTGRDRVEHTD